MSQLFSPFAIGALSLKNRIVIAPMCQYSAVDSEANDWHLIHLAHLALSGAGLLTIEATAVEPEGRITPGDLGLWSDTTEGALRRVLTAVRRHSPMPVLAPSRRNPQPHPGLTAPVRPIRTMRRAGLPGDTRPDAADVLRIGWHGNRCDSGAPIIATSNRRLR